ncbi:MAG: hypothetical protein LBH49_01110 [Puniceicoccales bacterium]|jgi:hypothetical protein|nr:hypothetical protein [Puniceicoccales bacterium]
MVFARFNANGANCNRFEAANQLKNNKTSYFGALLLTFQPRDKVNEMLCNAINKSQQPNVPNKSLTKQNPKRSDKKAWSNFRNKIKNYTKNFTSKPKAQTNTTTITNEPAITPHNITKHEIPNERILELTETVKKYKKALEDTQISTDYDCTKKIGNEANNALEFAQKAKAIVLEKLPQNQEDEELKKAVAKLETAITDLNTQVDIFNSFYRRTFNDDNK